MCLSFYEFRCRYTEFIGKLVEFIYPNFRITTRLESAEDALDELESKADCLKVYIHN